MAGIFGLGAGAAAMLALGGGAPAPNEAGRAQIEAIVRDYILAHPEILPEAMKRLEGREVAKAIVQHRAALEKPFAGGWAGAADADVVLVEFFDYACGFCRTSVADVDRLLVEDKKLKVVFRELPILGEGSEAAARASLAAAKQNRYLDFHRRMYAAGIPDAAKAQQVQKAAGLDVARAAREANAPEVAGEIDRNIELARALGVTGTPTFVVGDRLLSGAVGYDALKDAITEARKGK